MTCTRRAWLTMSGRTIALEDADGGWYCTELDLGYPEVREVVNNRPDADGIDDRTAFMGGRAISANVTVRGAPSIDDVAASFAPFMVPSARPQLHYVLDRGQSSPERVITVRASDYSWPLSGSKTREVHLSWIAADPVARDPNTQTATAWSGVVGLAGRTYNLAFPRVYPPGSGGATRARIVSPGDVPIKPSLRIYGPIAGPTVNLQAYTSANAQIFQAYIWFQPSVTIDAGHWVDVDLARHTVLRDGDPAQSMMASLDWSRTTWPALPVAPNWTSMALSGSGASAVTQVQATWQDGYLE